MPRQAPPSRSRPTASERSTRQISYHCRKCSICRHPQRSEIEQAFLDWECISSITTEFQLPGRTALYRHARAVGLLGNRNQGLRGALARIIEKACDAEPDAMAIVRAVELFARLNDDGELMTPAPRPAQARPLPDEPPTSPSSDRRSLHVRVEDDATC
ncbi:MAG: hypothetical protein ACRD5K_18485 [Candidatus Acidiferrales bacterium]